MSDTTIKQLANVLGTPIDKLLAQLAEAGMKEGFRTYFPRPEFCTDNGAMIALAGAFRLQAGQLETTAIKVRPRWDLASLPPVA